MSPTDPVAIAAFTIAGFLAGSIPFALLLGLAKGIDIRTVGSKNPGATNLGRALGFRWFLLCFLLDAGKGLAPVVAFSALTGLLTTSPREISAAAAIAQLAVMAAPVLGHMFSPWIGFKGGKGVATGLGALLGVYPVMTVAGVGAFVVFGLSLAIWRMVGVSSSLAAASLPLWVWWFFRTLDDVASASRPPDQRGDPDPLTGGLQQGLPYLTVALFLSVVVIWKHRSNLRRAFSGQEPKIGSPRPPAADSSRD
ncbi:MAG: glycerol-3-phosphate acyltransferase [Planctomycetota bacterium]